MTTLQQWFGRIAIGASNDSLTVAIDGGAPTAVTLTAGYYYLTGYTAEVTAQLCEHITAKIVAVGGDAAGVVCSYSASTGKVSFVAEATDDIDIAFTDTALRTILGFTADITELNETAQTATNEPKYVWRPNKGMSWHPVQLNQFFEPESNSLVYRSRDGTTYSVPGNVLYRADVRYGFLAKVRVIIPSTGSINQEFQQFMVDVIHAGQPIRVYPDRTLSASTSYETVIVDIENGIAFSDFCQRSVPNIDTYWDVSIPTVKHVT